MDSNSTTKRNSVVVPLPQEMEMMIQSWRELRKSSVKIMLPLLASNANTLWICPIFYSELQFQAHMSNDVVELHVGEVGELPEATAPPEVADVRELMDFPPATRIDPATSAMINTGDPRAVASLIQDMREAYQAQRDAYQAQRETWKAIENYYKRKT
ncbi:hypothetical protein Pmani_012273 [Petrolisthes manimaculis]|uniref:Uncharacterized protein n=1 Tax=Petrolisthes manimaculis TaxID=1843537 RepID=A0AAE1PYX1_9EUCA|nr:hypothetical protein Pmani_012273 [Petrolisthes manimaculis]